MKNDKTYSCTLCHSKILSPTKIQKNGFVSRGRIYCSKECGKFIRSQNGRTTLTATNIKYASERMKKNNPSFRKEVLEKVYITKSNNGTLCLPPKIQGGNGRETPIPVKMINDKIGWELRYIVTTKLKPPYPRHYKLEIANPHKKICIEVDGNSSYSRKEQSERKEEFLNHQGWKVIRFKNRDVLKNFDKCIEVIKNEMDSR